MAGDAETAGGLGLGDVLALDAAQHFVAHLQKIARIEERRILEGGIEHPFRMAD